MRALVFIHRWLGIPLCLLFAMWFSTGIVMHFVPFPALTEPERVQGMAEVVAAPIENGPADAVRASKLRDVTRVRLWRRTDGLVYIVANAAGIVALRADDLTSARVQSGTASLEIAADHARRRGLDASGAAFVEVSHYDQWTVPNGFDRHRPLHRVALGDADGTELYVSSATGEVVLDTTRRERAWNYVGSVVHWIYPTVLRKNWAAWNVAVWWISLFGLVAAVTGVVVGVLKIKVKRNRLVSPYRRWHAWHHWLGLTCMIFLTTWIFSGWLSMDHGRLFSEGNVTAVEARSITGAPDWQTLTADELPAASEQAREIEWFAFGGRVFRRERTALDRQRLTPAGGGGEPERQFLQPAEVSSVMHSLAPECDDAVAVEPSENYAFEAGMPGAPVYRSVCGAVWYHVDGGSGAILEKLDPSRRAYRWFYQALHTFDLPALMARPALRTVLIISLCGFGFVFSVTGVVIGWRRLRLKFWRPSRA